MGAGIASSLGAHNVSEPSRRLVLIVAMACLAGAFLAGPAAAEAAVGWPECPGLNAWAMAGHESSDQTRGAIASSWFASLRAQVPTIEDRPSLSALEANAKVTACAVAVTGPASAGLGAYGDVAIVIARVNAPPIELISFESRSFGISLPPMWLDEVGTPSPSIRAEVVRYRVAAPADAALTSRLANYVFDNANEVVTLRVEPAIDGGEERRIEVIGADDCGVFGPTVVIRSGVMELADSPIGIDRPTPTTCPSTTTTSLRSLLTKRPAVSLDLAALRISVGNDVAVLRPAPRSLPTRWTAILTTSSGKTYWQRRAVDLDGGLGFTETARVLNVHDCNASALIAFGQHRFVVRSHADFVLGPSKACLGSAANGLASGNRTGTYVHRGLRLTMKFSDNSTVEMQERKI